jgi:hypothetical protein
MGIACEKKEGYESFSIWGFVGPALVGRDIIVLETIIENSSFKVLYFFVEFVASCM